MKKNPVKLYRHLPTGVVYRGFQAMEYVRMSEVPGICNCPVNVNLHMHAYYNHLGDIGLTSTVTLVSTDYVMNYNGIPMVINLSYFTKFFVTVAERRKL